MAKRFYYCHNCEQGQEGEEMSGKAIYCRRCGRLINMEELRTYTLNKKKSKRKKKAE